MSEKADTGSMDDPLDEKRRADIPTLMQSWEQFRARHVPKDATPEVIDRMRAAFICGMREGIGFVTELETMQDEEHASQLYDMVAREFELLSNTETIYADAPLGSTFH